MYLVYIDESGDDGYPHYSNQLFILTACYFKAEHFNYNFGLIKKFRSHLKQTYGLYTGVELHLRELIQNKKPYTGIGLDKAKRKAIIDEIFNFIASEPLKVKFINVAIDKAKIKSSSYNVLETTLTYLIRRIENDIKANGDDLFISIADQGRVHIMNKTGRKLRRIAYLPSMYSGSLGNKPIQLMIEDILEKASTDSHFIQLSDCVARMVNLYTMQNHCNPKLPWIRKTRKMLNYGDEIKYLTQISNKLNLKASKAHSLGIKYVV